MKRIETKQKRAGVSIPPRRPKFDLRLGALNLSRGFEEQIGSDEWLRKSSLEGEIEGIVWKWRVGDKKFQRDYKELFSPGQVADHIKTLKKADTLLRRLTDWVREISAFPRFALKTDQPARS